MKHRLGKFLRMWLRATKIVLVIAAFFAINIVPWAVLIDKTDSDWSFAVFVLTLPLSIAFGLTCMDADI